MKIVPTWVWLVVLFALLSTSFAVGHHQGAKAVQAKWDVATAGSNVVATKASESARVTEQQQSNDFSGIETGYLQATTHAYPTIGASIPAAFDAGTVQLRDRCPSPAGGSVSKATAASRAADAASTQAIADRVENSIAAVRAGDAADARERQLDQQVTALQALLLAERKPSP